MKTNELLALVEEHVADELSFCMTITEQDEGRLKVILPQQRAEGILLIVENDDSVYENIFQLIRNYFADRVRLIKVRSVVDGEYLYMMIDGKVCILMQYHFENGKKWLYQICHEE